MPKAVAKKIVSNSVRVETAQKLAPKTIEVVFWILGLIVILVVGRDPGLTRLGLLASGALICGFFLLWTRSRSGLFQARVVLASALWLGFFHRPITSGNYIFWLQDVILIGLVVLTVIALPSVLARGLAPLLSLPIIAVFSLFGSLEMDSPLIYLNGLRHISVPPLMFLLGIDLARQSSGRVALRFLVWTLLLQLPASMILNAILRGFPLGFLYLRDQPGTFGWNGTGILSVHMAAIAGILVWSYMRREISLRLFVAAAAVIGFLTLLSDIKFLYILLPSAVVFAVLLGSVDQGRLRWKPVLTGILASSLILAILYVAISGAIQFERTSLRHLTDMFDAEFIRDYLRVDTGGMMWADNSGSYGKFTRYGAVVYALNLLSSDPVRLLTGFGLGSTEARFLGDTSLTSLVGTKNMNISAVPMLLFEMGILGTTLYCAAFFILPLLAVGTSCKARHSSVKMLSAMVAIYGFCVVASLPYNLLQYWHEARECSGSYPDYGTRRDLFGVKLSRV